METAELAVVASRLNDIKEDIAGMRKDISEYRKETVGRGEWVQRNSHVDERFKHTDDKFGSMGKEVAQLRSDGNSAIAALKTEISSRRAPWWSVGAMITSIAALLYTVFGTP